jgi:hypothetical protein
MYDDIKLPIGHAIMSLGWGSEELQTVARHWGGWSMASDASSYTDVYPDGPNCVVRATTKNRNRHAVPVTRFVEHMRHTIRILGDNRIVRDRHDKVVYALQPVANRAIDLD